MKLLAKYDESWIYGMCVREKHWGEIVLLLPFHWRGQNFFLKINWYINMSIISFLSWFKIIWNYISYVILVNSKLLSLLVHCYRVWNWGCQPPKANTEAKFTCVTKHTWEKTFQVIRTGWFETFCSFSFFLSFSQVKLPGCLWLRVESLSVCQSLLTGGYFFHRAPGVRRTGSATVPCHHSHSDFRAASVCKLPVGHPFTVFF